MRTLALAVLLTLSACGDEAKLKETAEYIGDRAEFRAGRLIDHTLEKVSALAGEVGEGKKLHIEIDISVVDIEAKP